MLRETAQWIITANPDRQCSGINPVRSSSPTKKDTEMSRRLLRLSPDYGNILPVWEETPGLEVGDLDPAESGLSDGLVGELFAWNARWEELLYSDLPEDEVEKLRDAWESEGRSLAKRIELELGKEIDVHVTYKP